MNEIYCGNNANDPDLLSGNIIKGNRYLCFKKGVGKGLSLPIDKNWTYDYKPIDNRKMYCGNKNLPKDYDYLGNLSQCLQKGVGVGKSIKIKQLKSPKKSRHKKSVKKSRRKKSVKKSRRKKSRRKKSSRKKSVKKSRRKKSRRKKSVKKSRRKK